MSEGPTLTRVAVVTGGAGSLGSAIAARLLADDLIVVLADADKARAEQVAAGLADRGLGQVVGWQVDVADESSTQAFVTRVAEEFGRLDCIVNNAGINRRGSLQDLRMSDWDAVMAVNLRGPVTMCQAALPHWQRQGSGRVINIGSRTWLSGGPAAYVTSKAGVVGLTRALAVELAAWDVTVNAVAPGMVDSPLTRQGREVEDFESIAAVHRRMTPLRRLAIPEDVAHAVSFFASEHSGFITGEVLHVCGGMQMAPAPATAVTNPPESRRVQG